MNKKGLLTLVIIAAIAAIAWGVLTMKDQRTSGERIGDAIDALPKGPDKAVRELKDRTPGEKVGDAVEDAGEKIKEKTGQE